MSVAEALDVDVSSGAFGGQRIVSCEAWSKAFDRPVPATAVQIPTDHGPVLVCCPVSGIPLTRSMIAVTGVSRADLAAMVHRVRPLGTTPFEFALLRQSLQQLAGDLGDPTLKVAIGGSSVGGFSSLHTATEKKRVPADAQELTRRIEESKHARSVHPAAQQLIVSDAVKTLERLQQEAAATPGIGSLPVAPWYGLLHRLHVERRPDLDIQVHSAMVDRVMLERARLNPAIELRRNADRLRRWNFGDICDAFPVIAALQRDLDRAQIHAELEFLGPGGERTIAARPDWWVIEVSSRYTAESATA